MFETGYKYSTICHYRSAISAYHVGFTGKPCGEHPKVSSLISGVFNQRPPQPRYTKVWDVQVVFDYLEKVSQSGTLPDRDLTLKTTMLIALTSAARSSGIHRLSTKHMTISDNQISFTYDKLHKSCRKGQEPTSIVFYGFHENKNLCVVSAIKEYLKRTEDWRKGGEPNQLFLSHIRPHNSVSSDTVARWIKRTLREAGINTEIFKAHSTAQLPHRKLKHKGLHYRIY